MNDNRKKVLLTGGSRGIGKAIYELLSEKGYDVFAPTRSELDLSCRKSIEEFVDKYQNQRFGVLINNAGINPLNSLSDIQDQDWEECLQVNLTASFLLIKGFSISMIEQQYGRIVNMASVWSVISKEKRMTYSVSKTGLIGLTRTAAIELGKHNILVNAISPGFIKTELTDSNLSLEEQLQLTSKMPLQRLGTTKEVAELTAFLVSDKNTFMSGQNVVIDGGFTIS
jgi:3-oxoacyl-[acyl-carrier protein] reductase